MFIWVYLVPRLKTWRHILFQLLYQIPLPLFFLVFSSFFSVWSWFQAFIWQDTAAKGHRNVERVLYWTLLFSSTGQSIAAVIEKQDLCCFLPSCDMGAFQPTHWGSPLAHTVRWSSVAIPYSKTGGTSHKDMEGKCQISAQPLGILMGSCVLLMNMSLKCTPKYVSDQRPATIQKTGWTSLQAQKREKSSLPA